MDRRSVSSRGFTLIELMVGMTVALIMTTAAVLFATQETRLITRSRETLEVQQSARAALSFIARDVRKAGMGIGYRMSGSGTGEPYFGGLVTGAFTLGSFQFFAAAVTGTGGGSSTPPPANSPPTTFPPPPAVNPLPADIDPNAFTTADDIMVSYASGPTTTVSLETQRDNTEINGFACRQLLDDNEEEKAVLFDAADLSSVVGTYSSNGSYFSSGPGRCKCFDGKCIAFKIANLQNLSSPDANLVPYGSGEIALKPRSIAWFVAQDDDSGTQVLKRFETEYEGTSGCTDRDADDCGGIVAYDIEDVNYAVWMFDETLGWQPATLTSVNEGLVFTPPIGCGWISKSLLGPVVRSQERRPSPRRSCLPPQPAP